MTIILTSDDSQYREEGCVIMHGSMDYAPTAPHTTYIYHPRRFNLKDIMEWGPVVRGRLVVVIKNLPSIPAKYADEIVIHPSLKKTKEGHFTAIEPAFKWSDRGRAFKAIQAVPMPLFLAFLRVNRPADIETWRRLADVVFFLPEEYAHAVCAYSIVPAAKRVEWPKKTPKKEEHDSMVWRHTDCYADIISVHAEEVVNAIRIQQPSELPKGVAKRQRNILEWL
tara:strand:- start:32887 stop:33558 length:672 start_codon:yes stop_codon:yes gene_type:complete